MDNIIEEKEAMTQILKEGFFEGLKSFANGITIKTPIIDISPKEIKPLKIEKSLYTKIEDFIENFKKILKNNSKDRTIVIFIDDLDRCEDESIINLLVALKLMFSLENIVFVCCIDKLATIEALKRKYNNNQEKAESFLDKLFLFDFNLIPSLKSKFLTDEKDKLDEEVLNFVFSELEIKNPRTIKKIINKILMLKKFLENKDMSDREKKLFYTYLYYMLSLKEKKYELFSFILNDINYAYERVLSKEKTNLHSINIKDKDIRNKHNSITIEMQTILGVYSNLNLKDAEHDTENNGKFNIKLIKEALSVVKKYI